MLYIIATPIGNLKEITLDAIEKLNLVDYILCEDTRNSIKLLNNLNINKKLVSYHKFNESKILDNIIKDLLEEKNIALISDAGMPGISDPGNILINELIKQNISYTVISGASAFVNAFVLSGYPSPFTFVGFLPDNNKKRKEIINELDKCNFTQIFYMSPHSILKDIEFLYSILGDRQICVVREISKKFEEVSFSTLKSNYNGTIKGEFVVLIKPIENNKTVLCNDDIINEINLLIQKGLSSNDAIKLVSNSHNLKKNEVYKEYINKN